ncbi:chlorite dismutase family protein [Paraconexibacter algicola]|nr:chlorite dismutase family protein [Paraconexibacter algicola]
MNEPAGSRMVPQPTVFAAGRTGPWRIESSTAVLGEGLPVAPRLTVAPAATPVVDAAWCVRGVHGHARYATAAEARELAARSAPLGRREATCGAMILVRKSAAWWALAQDERRELLEERSRHVSAGARYLPEVARRLFHGREMAEPFDFVTWFDFAPSARDAFDTLVATLRSTEEWTYVDREVDVRLLREDTGAPVPGG